MNRLAPAALSLGSRAPAMSAARCVEHSSVWRTEVPPAEGFIPHVWGGVERMWRSGGTVPRCLTLSVWSACHRPRRHLMDGPTTRCKFHCTSIETTEFGGVWVNLNVVYPNDRDGFKHGEDHAFFQATPQGTMRLFITNPY